MRNRVNCRSGFEKQSEQESIQARFPNHLPRISIISHRDELGVSRVIGAGPLQKLDLSDYLRLDLDALFHLLRVEALAPSALPGS